MEKKSTQLEQRVKEMISYMKTKIELKDWHAVADASMDIRELEAKIQVYREIE